MFDRCLWDRLSLYTRIRKKKIRNLSKHNILLLENLSMETARISVVPQKLVVRKVTCSILGANQWISNSVGISQSVDWWYMTTIYDSSSDWDCQRRLTIFMTTPDTLASGTSVIVSENGSLHRYHVYRDFTAAAIASVYRTNLNIVWADYFSTLADDKVLVQKIKCKFY